MTTASSDWNAMRLLAAVALACSLSACAASNGGRNLIVESGLTPTSDIRSAETAKPTGYIPVGVTPALPVADLSPNERAAAQKDLEAARARVRTLAAAPVDKPLPDIKPAAPAPSQKPPAPDPLNRGIIY